MLGGIPLKKNIFIVITVASVFIVGAILLFTLSNNNVNRFIKNKCGIDVSDGVIVRYDYDEEYPFDDDNAEKRYYFSIRFPKEKQDSIEKQIINSCYSNDFYFTDATASWWPNRNSAYHRSGTDSFLWFYHNSYCNSIVVDDSKDDYLYVHVSYILMENMGIA